MVLNFQMTIQHQVAIDESNNILLSPELTMLVIIDHQVAFESCFDARDIKIAELGVAELVDAAKKLYIPVISSLVETNHIDSKLSGTLETKLPQMTRLIRNGVNPWDDPNFSNAVHMANRPCLLIAGISAEISLSFTALSALARGFDVFVIKDVCLGHSEQGAATAFERLTQAGAVPVSWRQVLMEWTQGNVDVGLLRRILRPKKPSAHVNGTE